MRGKEQRYKHSNRDYKNIKSKWIYKRFCIDWNWWRNCRRYCWICFINIYGGDKIYKYTNTLLAQVDSSIGGKNAINVSGCKNLVGTFNQPHFIVIDNNFLKGLSRREIISGLAEALKYGIVCEYDFLTYIYIYLMDILRGEIEVIREIVKRSCKIKINIIKRDEYDTSIRKILNYGHTVGHAIESVTNYSVYTHGEAVIIGMYYESLIAFKLNLIDETYFAYIDFK